jgi:hypothetical protein
VMSPMDQTGKLYGPDYMTAYNTAAAEKTAHGEKFKNSSVTESVVDIKDILSGNDQLSEEFKEKAAIIFNTAVRMASGSHPVEAGRAVHRKEDSSRILT